MEFRARLEDRGYTPGDFAHLTGANLRSVTRWLAGEQDIPSWVAVMMDCLDRIARLEEQVDLSRIA